MPKSRRGRTKSQWQKEEVHRDEQVRDNWLVRAQSIIRGADQLSPQELHFVRQMLMRNVPPSFLQKKWLEALHERIVG